MDTDRYNISTVDIDTVKKLLRHKYRAHPLMEDLISEGYLALIAAKRGYDPNRGAKWSSYLATKVFTRTSRYLTKDRKYKEMLREYTKEVRSSDLNMSSRQESPQGREMQKQSQDSILHEMGLRLTPYQGDVVAMHAGLYGTPALTFGEIGTKLGVSKQAAYRTWARALDMLDNSTALKELAKCE